MYDYEERRIYYDDARALKELDELLQQEGIERDKNLEYTLGLYDGERLAATGSFFKNTLRCLAVDSSYQGEGLMNRVVSRLIDQEARRGVFDLFIYTKCDKTPLFRDLGFYEICRVEGLAAFLENRRDGFSSYLKKLEPFRRESGTSAAVVLNANPFTLGHQYLVERCAAENGWVHLFVVSEDTSLVPFSYRWELIKAGSAHLANISMHRTENYMISSATFPAYFIKDSDRVAEAQAKLDIQIFLRIAERLNISARYVGDEPFSQVTGTYNRVMGQALAEAGLRCVVVPRREVGGRAVSASEVREKLRLGQLEDIASTVPPSTFQFFHTGQGAKVIERIQQASSVIHH